jgi:hypothetical protein
LQHGGLCGRRANGHAVGAGLVEQAAGDEGFLVDQGLSAPLMQKARQEAILARLVVG